MNIKATLVLCVIRFFAKLTSTWPSNNDSNSFQRLITHCQWFFSISNVAGLLISLLLGAYDCRHEPMESMKVLSESTALTIIFFNLIFFKLKETPLRILLNEVVPFVMTIESEKRLILHKWVNRYVPIWIFGMIAFNLTAICFALDPLFSKELLPAATWYPFEIKPFTIRHYFFFIHHVVAIFQTGLGITADITISFLFCYLSVKLEILRTRMRVCRKSKTLIDCFREHEKCIQFFELLTNTVRFRMLINNWVMMMTIIFGAIALLFHGQPAGRSQYISMVIASYLRIYMNVWPADDVREMSQKIASSIYECSWVGASKKMQKSLSFGICRAQKPLVVSIPGLLPPITLQFYASFFSTTLSYFTALRAVIG